MKMKTRFLLGILLLSVCGFTGCSDAGNENTNNVIPFNLNKTSYEVRLKYFGTQIPITNGSGDFSVSAADETMVEAKIIQNEGANTYIFIEGKQKGKTTLNVTDNVTGDMKTVEVKVTDCYLAYAIAESNHPILKTGMVLFLVNNQARDYYLFVKDNMHGQLYNQPLVKGSYEFFVTIDSDTDPSSQLYYIPNLRLTYPSNEDGNLTDSSTATTAHDFQIELWGENASSSYALQAVQNYLGIDWKELTDNSQTKSPSPIDMKMVMTVPDTEYEITGLVSTASIPEGVLD